MYSYQEKNNIKHTNLQIKKCKTGSHSSKFFIHILRNENLFKKSELIFKHYFTLIRPEPRLNF